MNNEKEKTKKERRIQQPTLARHRILLKTISDNIRKGMTMGEAMKSVGYSDSYSESPTQLKDTDAWKELVSQELPDEKLVKTLNYLLDHKEWRAKVPGLDMSFKIKRKYAPIDIDIKRRRSVEEIEDEITGTLSEIGEIIRREE
jgi:hypothetical protein